MLNSSLFLRHFKSSLEIFITIDMFQKLLVQLIVGFCGFLVFRLKNDFF